MKQYLDLVARVLRDGDFHHDRTGVGTISVFGHQMRFDMNHGFPLVTTKKVHLRSIIHELLWMLKGDTNVQYLRDNGVTIWDEWADENGDLGPVYGAQWRLWRGDSLVDVETGKHTGYYFHDQIANLVEQIKTNPSSRRLIVSAWNVADLHKMALPPCHMMFQCHVSNNRLNIMLTQRSADIFLGLPFNIAFYSLLLHMLAQQCDLIPGEFIWSGGDCHIYTNHLEQMRLQGAREPRRLPRLFIRGRPESIFDYKFEDFAIVRYDPHPAIKGEVAV